MTRHGAARQKNTWTVEEVGGLPLVFSPLLASEGQLTHAFTTRLGGDSEKPLDSFNLGRHWPTDQSRKDAMRNRQRLCSVFGLTVNRLVVPGQVHSSKIAWVTGPESLPDCDGVATVTQDTPILLHYADCVPIIIFDRVLSAAVVVHAGWRGTASGIAGKAVRLLSDTLGSQGRHLVAAVGPAIGSCCYPTGGDVAEKLLSSVDEKDGLVEVRDGTPYPDLKAINAVQLLEAGVGQVDVTSFCTACHPDMFYSHRRDAGQTGRQGALACIKGEH